MYNPFSLEGKTILITGASSGIGRATAIECSKMGATVILTARNEERLQQTLDDMEGEGHKMICCDMSSSNDIKSLISDVPVLDGIVLNAGFTKLYPIPFIKETELLSILQVNTMAPILLLNDLVKKKKLAKGSSVVFTSSMAGLGKTSVGNSIYTASKGAISSFVKCAGLELAAKKIRVNAVCPAMVDTGILSSGTISEEQLQADIKNYPLGRYGKPEDIAYSMIYLLSDASAWVTGTNLVIDGGISAK